MFLTFKNLWNVITCILGKLLGILLIVILLPACHTQAYNTYAYDNGQVKLDLEESLKIQQDYSYLSQTFLTLSILEDNAPNGIATIQITDKFKLSDVNTAYELYEKDLEKELNVSDYVELLTETSNGGMWTINLDGEEMKQLYLTKSLDDYIVIVRVLASPEYLNFSQEYFTRLVDSMEIYGKGVLTPGPEIHKYFENEVIK